MARHRAAPMLLLFAAVLFFNVSRVCTQQIEIPKGTNNGPTPYGMYVCFLVRKCMYRRSRLIEVDAFFSCVCVVCVYAR